MEQEGKFNVECNPSAFKNRPRSGVSINLGFSPISSKDGLVSVAVFCQVLLMLFAVFY